MPMPLTPGPGPAVSSEPRVAGATGGSGTRVVARIMRRGGTFIGTRLNEFEDAIEVGLFLNDWIRPYISSVHRGVPMDPELATVMAIAWKAAIARHRAPVLAGRQPYGWKEPRSLYLLPFWHARYPGLRFVHLIRDGRDMALSRNQNQLNLYGDLMVPETLGGAPTAVRAIALWSRLNLWAAEYGERHMHGQYLRIRFEDLCLDPRAVCGRLFDFLGLCGDPGAAATEVSTPPTAGRWRQAPAEVVAPLLAAGGEALGRFGYV